MAVDLHSKDSLLLPSFRFATEERNNRSNRPPIKRHWSSTSCFSASSDFGSSLNSPVGSEFGSTESESDRDDDDYIAELTREMAQYMLQDDDDKNEKTFSEMASSQEEAFGKFEKLNVNKEVQKFDDKSVPSTVSTSTVRKPNSLNNVEFEFQSKQALIDDQIRAIQLCKFKQDRIMKHMNQHQVREFQGKGRDCVGGFISNAQKGASRTNNLQQQNQHGAGSQMRAVFLGKPGSRNGLSRGGTGVFLPRGTGGNDCEPCKKKPGFSTVLIPARVLQALKLHFDKMGAASRVNVARLPIQHDPWMGDVWYGLQLQQKSQSRTVPAKNHHQEMGLPQEWTY